MRRPGTGKERSRKSSRGRKRKTNGKGEGQEGKWRRGKRGQEGKGKEPTGKGRDGNEDEREWGGLLGKRMFRKVEERLERGAHEADEFK